MRVKPIIQVNGNPLRWAYVEHIVLGGGTNMYITDDEGRVRDIHGDEGVDNLTDGVDIRVICQNPVLRVVDGTRANIGVDQNRFVRNGDVMNLDAQSEQDDWYAVLNRAQLAYEVVFRPLGFFQDLPNPDFPLGRKATLRETRDQARRIELSYPDRGPQPLAYVEPTRLIDGYPLMHIKERQEDGRLFGERGTGDNAAQPPILIPHELTHALHFTFLSDRQRGRVIPKYIDFLLGDFAAGGDLRHTLGKTTTPEVAYIEAGGNFGEAFWEFARRRFATGTLVRPERVRRDAALLAEFARTEFTACTSPPPLADAIRRTAPVVRGPVGPVMPIDRHFSRVPRFTGGDCEGAVYGAIFTDFAQDAGLDVAASAFFKANALTFGEYRDFIHREMPQHDAALERARAFWRL